MQVATAYGNVSWKQTSSVAALCIVTKAIRRRSGAVSSCIEEVEDGIAAEGSGERVGGGTAGDRCCSGDGDCFGCKSGGDMIELVARMRGYG
jgi:hypothetical protein